MSILVALIILSFIVNSLVSRVVVQLARALENNTYSSFQKYIVKIACIFLRNIVFISVIIIRVREEEVSRLSQSKL